MKTTSVLKYSGLAALMLTVAVGCATTSNSGSSAASDQQAVAGTGTNAGSGTAGAASSASASSGDSYKVVSGDCLWRIAGKSDIYGNHFEWPLIYKANHEKIKDADLIYPGQVLTIVRNPSAAEVAAAVKHAKTRGPWKLGTVPASDTAYLSL